MEGGIIIRNLKEAHRTQSSFKFLMIIPPSIKKKTGGGSYHRDFEAKIPLGPFRLKLFRYMPLF
jgi:hypothetical protein